MGGFEEGTESEDERLSARLLETGAMTPEQLALCLAERDRHRSGGSPTRLAEVLLAGGLVGAPRLSEILSDVGIEPFGPGGLPPEAAAQADTERFGKFTRVQLLGDGGMGQVWKAWDSSLGRWVALKFLKGRDRSDVARLLREAQTAGRLSHPNIVAVHEVGTERGEHYIAMQYIDGQTLETHPRTDRKDLVRLIRDAARAVALAHREGVVHRDLKPSNLMVAERPGSPPHVYVADFGLARSISDPAHLSRTGMILGTPDYMSPEQAKGEAVDERTDVWALGATLYELTTDRPPFASSNLINLLKRIADEDPKRPRRIQPRIAPDLETIILKCLEKDAARRYAKADQLADDLDRYLAGEPIQARKPSLPYRIRKRLAKRKALAVGTLIALFALGALATRLWQAHERESSLKELGSLWMRLAEAKEELRSPLEEGSSVRVKGKLQGVVDEISWYIGFHPRQPQGYFVRARGRFYLDDLIGARQDLATAVELDPSFAPGFSFLGRLKLEECRRQERVMTPRRPHPREFREALEPLLREARELLGKGGAAVGVSMQEWGLPSTRDDEIAEILQRALVARYVNDDQEAAIQILTRAVDAGPSEELMNCLGNVNDTVPEQVRWQGMATARRPHFAFAYYDLGLALHEEKEKASEAISAYDSAIRANPRFSAAHVRRAELRWRSMDKLWEEHRRPEAAKEAAKVIDDYSAAIAIEPLNDEYFCDRASFLSSVWQLYDQLGRPTEAKEALDGWLRDNSEAIRLNERNAEAWEGRARYREETGDLPNALADCERGLSLSKKASAASSRYLTASAHELRGRILTGLGDHSRAAESYAFVMDFELRRPLWNPDTVSVTLNGEHMTATEFAKREAMRPARDLLSTCSKLYAAGDVQAALVGFTRIAEAFSDRRMGRDAACSVACGYARLGKKEAALEWLERAFSYGFRDPDRLEKDPDFDSIRDDPKYRELVRKMKEEPPPSNGKDSGK